MVNSHMNMNDLNQDQEDGISLLNPMIEIQNFTLKQDGFIGRLYQPDDSGYSRGTMQRSSAAFSR